MITMVVASMILLIVAVLAVVLVKNCLPGSISEMVYALPSGGWRWTCSIWLWVVLVLLTPRLMTVLDDSCKVLGFLTVGSLAFSLFEDTDRRWHYVLAIAGGVLSQVCVALICPWWLLLWGVMVYLCGKAYFDDEKSIPEELNGKGVFICEVICMMTLYGAILVN